MKRNLFSFPRSQMVGKMLRAMSFVVAGGGGGWRT